MMQNRIEVVTGDYCFNILNSLVDYCGDIKRKQNCDNDQRFKYSENYSPNNIRRLILSGDGARIDFHVSVNGKMSKTRVFSDSERSKMQECIYGERYKPMTWVLAERVCSSIEEIIICTENIGGVDLSQELNVEGLLKNYKPNLRGENKDIKDVIASRYKRLCYFTIVNCSISELISNDEVKRCIDCYSMISETDFVKSRSNSELFKKDDWFNYYGHSSVYAMDCDGGRLIKHFNDVKLKIEKNSREEAIEKIRNKRFKEFNEKFDKAFKNYRGVYDCYSKLKVITNVEGFSYISRNIGDIKTFDLKDPNIIKKEYEKLDSRDKIVDYIKNITSMTTSIYSALAIWFFEGLSKIKSEYPITYEVIESDIDRRITVPPSCKGLETASNFDGSSMSDSTANICSYACKFFITNIGTHDVKKYTLKETWYKSFK